MGHLKQLTTSSREKENEDCITHSSFYILKNLLQHLDVAGYSLRNFPEVDKFIRRM